jgi:tetrahydromethanopterin S-methyltransferase subunit B
MSSENWSKTAGKTAGVITGVWVGIAIAVLALTAPTKGIVMLVTWFWNLW